MITSDEVKTILGWWHIVKDIAKERGWTLQQEEKELVSRLRGMAKASEEDIPDCEGSAMMIDGVTYVVGSFDWFDESNKEIVKDE